MASNYAEDAALVTSVNSNRNVIAFITPDSAFDVLENQLMCANYSIDIMVYEFWSEDLFNIIEEVISEKEDIRVRVLLEGDVGWGGLDTYDEYNRWMAYKFYNLSSLGYNVSVRLEDDGGKYLHAKVIIIDSKIVIISSDNFVPTAFPEDPTNIDKVVYSTASRGWGIAIHNSTIAEEFTNIFENEFANAVKYDPSEHGTGQKPSSKGTLTYSSPFINLNASDFAAIETAFSPENSQDKILDLIGRAKHFILLELMYISNKTSSVDALIDALKEAKERGVTVQIILEDDMSYYDEIADNLVALGFHVAPAFYSGSAPLFCHNKGILVDDKYVLVGSINWSGKSLTTNREAGVIVKSRNIAVFYRQVFGWDWHESIGDVFDSDGDGLSDAYELEHGLNASDIDTDNDGLKDYDEVLIYQTDPKDPYSPGIHIISPLNNSYISSRNVTIRWESLTNVSRYIIYLNGTLIADISGNATEYVLENLDDEKFYVIEFVAELQSGTNVTWRLLLAIDTKPPALKITHPKNNSFLLTGEVRITWSANDFSPLTYVLSINSTIIYTGPNNDYSKELSEGDYIISLKAIDAADNENHTEILIHVRGKPMIAILFPQNNTYINNTRVLLQWAIIGDFPIDRFSILINNTGYDESIPGNQTDYELELINERVYNVSILAFDSNGDILATSYVIFGVDTAPPQLQIISPENNSILNPGEITIKWSATDFSSLKFLVYINETKIYEGTETRIKVTLSQGNYRIKIVAIDAAGNAAIKYIQIKITRTVEFSKYLNILIIGLLILVILTVIIIRLRKG